ncbi:MAG: hypothetical protein DELT_01525 [Desulfovibrio sp.]
MGIGIEIRAAYQGHEDDCRENIRAFFEHEDSVVPGKRIAVIEYGSSMQADLFFAEENVYFMFDADEPAVVISAKTNSAGPGYHAYLVALFTRMKNALSLSWDEEDVYDESEYWHHRDFADLQASMGMWLENLSSHLVENLMDDDVSGLALSMDADKVPDSENHYAAHLLGWRERDFFTHIARRGIMPEQCASYFIWWNEQADAEMFHKCALAMMWCDCNWLPPVTEGEKALFTSVFLCLEKAWDEDPSLPFPSAEWKEMAALSQSADIAAELEKRFPALPDSSFLIGYARGPVRRHVGSGWRFTMPGSMHEEIEGEDGTVLVYWNNDITARISRFTVSGEDIGAVGLLDSLTESAGDAVDFPLRNQEGVLARVNYEPRTDDAGNTYFCSCLFAATDSGKVLYMSVCYDEESTRSEAETIFASLSLQDA